MEIPDPERPPSDAVNPAVAFEVANMGYMAGSIITATRFGFDVDEMVDEVDMQSLRTIGDSTRQYAKGIKDNTLTSKHQGD